MKGDTEAFGRLVAHYQSVATSIALSVLGDVALSEDVAQEAFIKAWRELPKLRNPASFPGWLRQITRNVATDHVRGRRRVVPVTPALRDEQPDVQARMEALEEQDALARAVEDLSTENREVVILYYREGQSVAQVARLLDLTEAAVRKRMSRAREQLRADVMEQLGKLSQDTQPTAAFAVAVLSAVHQSTQLAAPVGAVPIALATTLGLGLLLGLAWWVRPELPPLAVATTPGSTSPTSVATGAPTGSSTSTTRSLVAGTDGFATAGENESSPESATASGAVDTWLNDEETGSRSYFMEVDVRNAGAEGGPHLSGRVLLDDDPPPRPRLRRNTDPVCARTEAYSRQLLVDEEGGVADVVIIPQRGALSVDPEAPARHSVSNTAKINIRDCTHEPRVTLMTAGDLFVHNDDPTLHNVHVYRGRETEFNKAMPPGAKPLQIRLETTGYYTIKCDVHPWEEALVYVSRLPYITKTDAAGRFDLPLPPGTYDVYFRHDVLGTHREEVEVLGPTTLEVTLTQLP